MSYYHIRDVGMIPYGVYATNTSSYSATSFLIEIRMNISAYDYLYYITIL